MVSEEMINDMSYIAMREISLSYSFPKKLMPINLLTPKIGRLWAESILFSTEN
jgi:hypothetical protein